MGEDDIRQYLSGKALAHTPASPTTAPRTVARRPRRPPQETYRDFNATHLMCPRCKKAQPVRQSVMLYLPDGDLHNYACTVCGTSVGTRKAGR